jgi:hypothetical protein
VLGGQRVELRDQDSMPAELELGPDALLDRCESELLEPRGLGVRPRFVGQIGQRRAAPQRERLSQRRGALRRVQRSGVREQPLETLRVDRGRRDCQDIARRLRAQDVPADQLPHLRDGVLERAERRRWRALAPQVVDQPVRGDHLAGADEQRCEQRTLLPPRQRNRVALAVPHLQRPQ